jgi:hypothetical protein
MKFNIDLIEINLIEICRFPYRNKDSEGTI